jgi:signal transduction histidine kinase
MFPRLLTTLRDSLRGRLIVLAGVSLLATCVLAAVLTWMAHGHERAALIRDLQSTSRAMTGVIDQEFDTREKMMRLLAGSPALLKGDLPAFYNRAARIASGTREWIVLTDLQGQQLVNTRLPYGAPLPRAEFYPGLADALRQDRAFVTDLVVGPVAQRPVVAVVVPVTANGTRRYALAMVVTPDAFIESIDLSQISPSYVMSILDRTGTIIARHPSGEKFVGKKATPDVVRRALLGQATVGPSVTLEGIPVLTAFTASPRYGWGVVIGAPTAILSASMLRLALFSLVATAATLLALAVLGWWILRGVLHDMRMLEADAERFAQGQLAPAREWTLSETKAAAQAMRRTLMQLHTELRHRTEAEAALRLADQRFRLAAANDGIVLFEQDADLRYTWLHSHRPEDQRALGRTDADFVSEAGAGSDYLIRLKREVLATGAPRRGEVTVQVDGAVRHYSLFITPKRDARGLIVGVAGAALDITDRKNAEQALTRAQHELLRANAELETKVRERTASISDLLQQMEEFTYSVSHDLRAPIRAMTSFSGILLEDHADKLDADGRSALQRIVTNGQKMDRLINDLLAFSRVSREVLELHPVSLQHCLADAVREIQAQHPTAQFVLEPRLPDVVAHPTLLSQVLINLLGNAAKFTAPGVTPLVRVSGEIAEQRLRLFVRDNGIGIKPELQPRLFRVFERLHLNGAYEGTGIGLAIVRRAMERMGGRVGVESDGVHGSCFWIELGISTTPAPARSSARLDQGGAVRHV